MEVKKRKKKQIVIEFAIYALALFFAAVIVPRYLLQRTVVDGDSMEPALYDKESLWVEKVSYRFEQLKRFDIIVFYPYGEQEEEYYIKRIIGLPGENIQIMGESIYINDVPLDEDFGKNPITFSGIAKNVITLLEDEYFVLGDNREVSFDSRYAEIGPVKKRDIAGKAILRIWPIAKIGTID